MVQSNAPAKEFHFVKVHYKTKKYHSGFRTLKKAGRPHPGAASETEKQLVRKHLFEVNRRLVAAGIRPINPVDPNHAERYGFPIPE